MSMMEKKAHKTSKKDLVPWHADDVERQIDVPCPQVRLRRWRGIAQHLIYFYTWSNRATKRPQFAQSALYYWLMQGDFEGFPCACLTRKWFKKLGCILTDAPLTCVTWRQHVHDEYVESCDVHAPERVAPDSNHRCPMDSLMETLQIWPINASYALSNDASFFAWLVWCNTTLYSVRQSIPMSTELSQQWWHMLLTCTQGKPIQLYLAEIGQVALKQNVLSNPLSEMDRSDVSNFFSKMREQKFHRSFHVCWETVTHVLQKWMPIPHTNLPSLSAATTQENFQKWLAFWSNDLEAWRSTHQILHEFREHLNQHSMTNSAWMYIIVHLDVLWSTWKNRFPPPLVSS